MTALSIVHADKPSALTVVHDTMEALKAIRTFIAEEFREGLDYGVIPGTGTKPTLLLPGAQKAMMYFNVAPTRQIDRAELGGGHLEVLCTTRLVSRSTGHVVGEGSGSCTSMEKKYRWRKADRVCPNCGAAAIKVSKFEGEGFYCFAKIGGCGAKYRADDPAITSQPIGQAENPDVHDTRNTILKMGIKRADVSAAMSLACLSELFTQDLEDTYDLGTPAPAPAEPAPAPRQTPPPKTKAEWPGKGPGTAGVPVMTPAAQRTNGDAPTPEPKTWSLYRRLKDAERLPRGKGLFEHVSSWGQRMGYAARMNDWTPEQVESAEFVARTYMEEQPAKGAD